MYIFIPIYCYFFTVSLYEYLYQYNAVVDVWYKISNIIIFNLCQDFIQISDIDVSSIHGFNCIKINKTLFSWGFLMILL